MALIDVATGVPVAAVINSSPIIRMIDDVIYTKLRMDCIKISLIQARLSLSEICLSFAASFLILVLIGFFNLAHFTRAFLLIQACGFSIDILYRASRIH